MRTHVIPPSAARAASRRPASAAVLSLTMVMALGCGGGAAIRGAAATTVDGDVNLYADVPRRSLTAGEHRAELLDSDPVNDGHAHFHIWRVELRPDARYRITMRSRAVDPLLEVRGPGDLRLRSDDAFPGSLDAMVELQPEQAGTYEVWTQSLNADEVGAYTLSVTPLPSEGVGQPIELGVDANASLGSHAQAGFEGTWLRFEGQAGAIVRLRITSREFDTVATLLGPGGETWFNDDAGELGDDGSERALDSTLVAALPRSGVYQLVVAPYGGNGRGAFRVRSTIRPPVMVGEDGRRPEGLAGPHGGRVLGLYAGITEYPTQGRLYGCAEDARLLAEAMRLARLQDEGDQIVLPDSLATREAFVGGIRDLASRARPEDVVIVFFSGHGNQTLDEGEADEVDGQDETIMMVDGALRDDEVVAALSEIHAGTVLLALDSCHAGGFADDWVTAPGRMGVFSSDEDVLSDVATPREAGGYLAWHLRRGVLGEADARPRDGVLHAGELTDYLYRGFVADDRLMNPPLSSEPMQRLVVRRGAVRWSDLLWVYPRGADLSLLPLPDSPLTTRR